MTLFICSDQGRCVRSYCTAAITRDLDTVTVKFLKERLFGRLYWVKCLDSAKSQHPGLGSRLSNFPSLEKQTLIMAITLLQMKIGIRIVSVRKFSCSPIPTHLPTHL